MNILDKFNKINITTEGQKRVEYLDLQMTKEEYEYCKNIEEQYNVAYELLKEYNSKIVENIKNFSTKNELEKWNKNKYILPIFGRLCDYGIKENELKYCNCTFISEIQNYFSVKYKKEMNIYPDLNLINKKLDEQLTITDVMNYIRVRYNWRPTQK